MQKNILIIGYGDIAKRLVKRLASQPINIYAISRNGSDDLRIKNLIGIGFLIKKLILKLKPLIL